MRKNNARGRTANAKYLQNVKSEGMKNLEEFLESFWGLCKKCGNQTEPPLPETQKCPGCGFPLTLMKP